MPDERPVICFGEQCLFDAVAEAHVGGKLREGHVTVLTDLLVAANVDYMAEVRIYRRPPTASGDVPDEASREFTGRVAKAFPGGALTRLELASMAEMDQTFAGEWSTAAGMPIAEIIWTLARDSGVPEERLDIYRFRRQAEMFEVAAPLDGLQIDRPFVAAGVTFTDSSRVAGIVERFEDADLRANFVAAGAWASTIVGAGTAWEAERMAVSRIELALALVTLRLRFSGAHLNGVPRHFDSELTRIQPRHREVVAVRSLSGRRHWLRFIGPGSTATLASVGQTLETTRPQIARGVSEQVREAVRAWHRAATAREPATALGALWEAIEFYASGTTLPPTFNRTDLKLLRKAASTVLNETQYKRFEQVLSLANDQSLMPKLEERLRLDGVPHTAEELEVLRATRTIRNDFVHGRSRASVTDQQLETSLAVVNRMLAYRLVRLGAGD